LGTGNVSRGESRFRNPQPGTTEEPRSKAAPASSCKQNRQKCGYFIPVLTTKGDGSQELIFLPYLARAEREIAQRIARLVGLTPAFPAIQFEQALAWCEERTRKQLAESQREALRQVLRNRLSIITGGPGLPTICQENFEIGRDTFFRWGRCPQTPGI
jgi:hypothetical protein